MAGTTLVSLANLAKNRFVFKTMMLSGLLTSLYGTWAFVRPFVVKDVKGVEKNKHVQNSAIKTKV